MADSDGKRNEDNATENIIPRVIEDEMKQSYLDYAMSVIVGRALPDVRDGLKPVHRRVLFGMHELGNFHNKPFKKSARIVGEILGKFHPHGDVAVYDTVVRMVQDFSLRYPLIEGQGNFGSVDGDSAAAMRYTEVRLAKIAEEMLADIDKETVDFVPNFDNTLKEPTVLPSKLPNLLINGSSGIAVGMATNIPPHNIAEICDAVITVIDKPDTDFKELMNIVKGPDFPTGALLLGKSEIENYFRTGRGKLLVRAKTKIEEKRNRQAIIVTEIPYQVNKSQLLEEIAELIRAKKITGISDLRDESDREGMRVVIELKQGANSNVVQNQLFKHTRMQTTFGAILLVLVDNQPKIIDIKQLIILFIQHRKEVITRRTGFELKQAEEKAHILEGLIKALDNIDAVIAKIKKSKDINESRFVLMRDYDLTEIQAKAILDMRLQRLAALEQEKIRQERKETLKLIKELKHILEHELEILKIIKKELVELKEKYGDIRKTKIIEATETEIETEDLIKEEEMVVTYTHQGYIKKIPLEEYRQQKRGGKGIIGTETKEDDFVEQLYITSTHDYLLLFTDKGKVHWIKVYNIPTAPRQSKGKPIVNLLMLDQGEKINAILPVKDFESTKNVVIATKKGVIKKTNLAEFSSPRKGGIIALSLDEDDSVVNVSITDGSKDIVMATRNGMAIKFKEDKLRTMGRTARGVTGIKLRADDYVIGMETCNEKQTLLTITENGYGKRSKVEDYRATGRAGIGVINIKTTDRNGKVVAIKTVTDEDELMFISQKGIIIRTSVQGISVIGRATQGVRLMKLEADDRVVAAAYIANENESNTNNT